MYRSLLIVGCGYVGQPVARHWLTAGGRVAAVTRGGDSTGKLRELGIEPIESDWLSANSNWGFDAQCVLVAVPHRADERFNAETHVVGLANLLQRMPNLQRLVVLSTTGVYNQNDGQWVDEQSPTHPQRIGPQIALAAEQWLQAHVDPQRFTSLRLAGIYGPGRVPLLTKLQSQEPLPVSEGFLNLVHLDDIVPTIVTLLSQPAPSSLYVLSDGHPVARRQFYLDAANIFSTPTPQFTEVQPDSSRAARSESNKRINPAKILRELNIELRAPDHLSGLRQCSVHFRTQPDA